MKDLQNLKLNWLMKNYTAVTSEDSRKSMTEFNLDDWNNYVTEIWFGPESKLSKQALGFIEDLKSLKVINLDEYSSNYDISYDEVMSLLSNNINVIYNTKFKYSDTEINKAINIEVYNQLISKREALEERIEMINAQIHDLGITEYN